MSIQFPDISQYTPVSLAGAPVAIARATISTVTDSHWASNVADAASHNVPLLGYCFLNAGSLGVSPEAQADYAYQVVGDRPVMLDHEPNRGACATLGEACRWIDRFRYRGGVVRLHYLPHWGWQQLGSPGLQTLADRNMLLVASNYTSYSDSGPGWQPYYPACPVPVVQWQFSDSHPFNGAAVDWNAYRGTVSQYIALSTGRTNVVLGQDDIQAIVNALLAARIPGTTSPDHPGDRAFADGQHDWMQLRAILIGQLPVTTWPADSPLARLLAAAGQGAPVALTDEQANAGILAALKDPTVLAGLAAALVSHIH